jgi:hypothetical protein
MSYLFFMDESGHDHKTTPYEVRGGVALPDHRLWAFVQDMQQLEINAFGDSVHRYGKEIKGHKLLDKDRFKWAAQTDWMEDDERRKACVAFLNRGPKRETPRKHEFTAYGQACLTMARGIFRLLDQHQAVVLATIVPDTCCKPDDFAFEDFLRKDHVYLFQRYFDFLDTQSQHGLLVMDETEKTEDRRFVARMHRYFSRTRTGILRASRVVPVPLFVSSDMSYPVQAADCVIYCINWGFRLPAMVKPVRQEVADESASWIHKLQAKVSRVEEGQAFTEWGIKYVDDPYTGQGIKKGGKAHG